jgi:hypothetical protein
MPAAHNEVSAFETDATIHSGGRKRPLRAGTPELPILDSPSLFIEY